MNEQSIFYEEDADEIAKEIAKAVYHWISFELICRRDNILSEYALRFPVGIVLDSNYTQTDGWVVTPEDRHPIINGNIDFTVSRDLSYQDYMNGKSNEICLGLEMKYFCAEPFKAPFVKQRIITDICRLKVIDKAEYDAQRYFLWVGRSGFGRNESCDPEKKMNDALSFMGRLFEPEIQTQDNEFSHYFEKFFSKWYEGETPVINTKLLESLPSNCPSSEDALIVKVWKVF